MNITLRIILLFIILTTFSKNLYSYTLYYVGEVESRVYNDAWSQFFDKKIKVYAGASKEDATIGLSFDMSLTEFTVAYRFDYVNDKDLAKNNFFNDLIYSLNKGIEWSQIAKDNSAETQKKIKVDLCNMTLEWEGVYCEATFFSANQGNQTDFILLVKEDGEYSFNEDKFYIDFNNQKKLQDILLNQVKDKLLYSLEQQEKSADLFN